MELKQYEIILVNLNPTMGSEINKTRPCVVISPNEMNKHLRTIIVAPMTTSSKSYPTRIEIKHNDKIGWVVVDQIRTIDKKRVFNKRNFNICALLSYSLFQVKSLTPDEAKLKYCL